MEINHSKKLDGNQYYPTGYDKKSIFIHHTAGTSAKGAIDWWNQTPEHVGTAYVIDRDGTVYEVFSPKQWAYHLGIKGDDDWQEKHSIGIEIVSAGQLYKEGNDFMFYPLYPNKTAKTKISAEEVYEVNWKDNQYFHKYTDKQVDSVKSLLEYLIKTFNIALNEKPIRELMEFDESIYKSYKAGIFTHSSVRIDKKDIFPQKNLLEAIDSVAMIKKNITPEIPKSDQSSSNIAKTYNTGRKRKHGK